MNKNEIIEGDCLEVMRAWPDDCIDAVVTDPPYFTPATHYQSRIKWKKTWADMSILSTWWQTISIELARTCKNTAHVLVFCHAESYPAFFPAMYSLWDKIICLVWDKGHMGLGRIWRHQHEFILAARNQEHYFCNDNYSRSDILRYNTVPSAQRQHPAEKPVLLIRDLISTIARPGEIVLDPFAGSGTTCIAAHLEGVNWLGIERDAEYYKIARARIDHWTRQGNLFR